MLVAYKSEPGFPIFYTTAAKTLHFLLPAFFNLLTEGILSTTPLLIEHTQTSYLILSPAQMHDSSQ